MVLRDLFLGFVKIHILYHAGQQPVYGLWLIEELEQHGYDLSPGTLYPALKSLENEGFLRSEKRNIGGKIRKYYTLTEAGQVLLDQARVKVNELAHEIREGSSS
jgi:PadR family transcriptional regulator, regulatory protein PadR